MVIQTSNSCSTLVSLEEYKKPIAQGLSSRNDVVTFQKTNLLLPSDSFDDDEDCSCFAADPHLYLPSAGPVDIYLRGVPQVMETADDLLSNPVKVLGASSSQRILAVGQGEVAHCTPDQADVIVSDKATTCHVLLLKSTSNRSNVLVSCAHLDSVHYESCVRAMIAEHETHHNSGGCEQEEKKDDYRYPSQNSSSVSMEIHILGGFEDTESRNISDWLIRLLGSLSHEFQSTMSMRLSTCAISSMNDDGRGCPMGRGFAMNLHTGTVFLAKVEASVAGPLLALRAARLWSGGDKPRRLTLIHVASNKNISIQPFQYTPMPESLLALPDPVLLHCTSTSPHAEEPEFCDLIRSTLIFMNTVRSDKIFSASRPLLFVRVGHSNQWRLQS